MLRLSSEESFHFELLRTLAHSHYGGADVGEIKRTEWVLSQAEKSTNLVSIREVMYRACTYFRSDDLFLHDNWNDRRIMYCWEKQMYCFNRAMKLLSIPGERLRAPAEGFEVPILFFPTSQILDEKWPTITMGNGFDQSMEEIRYQNFGVTHKLEKVVTPVLDHLATQSNVDMSKIGLVGNSMHGLTAARAASEHRIAAVMSIDVTHRIWSFIVKTPTEFMYLVKNYILEGIADQIQCPVFVGNAARDMFMKVYPEAMRDALGDNATHVLFY
ncbi:uncharacterized protein BDR25DRAFT_328432 [Lindgomyces ingoldianus]|uniref:Uncharacterized protein n=1 Tax=Lindgomyces ingoldianus TaxID=673940 RepID=A0ACB6QHV5_9PLEO|nr:uncharacterized protein BDR25DRAFT_328432 [Lindgomyces ingoldianus]KAF2465725.1 hypothetical protein BDR25DRAFT_328432 [Lindgomyces ingoldianus]